MTSKQKNRTEEEQDSKINELLQSVPIVDDLFDLHGKVGEGTFSSVFLATLKQPKKQFYAKKEFAVKHLVPTCHPKRIERELRCLKEIGGTDHVAGLELCLRNAGSVVFILPFMRHDRFVDYVHDMGVEETKNYMRALMTALRRVHEFNIIHRDIKPNNFLYDRQKKQYMLVDFGLAEEYKKEEAVRSQTTVLAGKRKRGDENVQNVESFEGCVFQLGFHAAHLFYIWKTVPNSHNGSINKLHKSRLEKCSCFGNPTVCSLCQALPLQYAPRAGTPGYRAPEVLLKHPHQTPAIDIWAAGVIMLCILSRTENFFRSPNDTVALAEIITLFGTSKLQQISRKLGKTITCSENAPGFDITGLCLKLQKRKSKVKKNEDKANPAFPSEAYDFLTRLLDLDYQRRITAEQALNHPFLRP